MRDTVDEMLAAAMADYDRRTVDEPDPLVRRLMQRDRHLVEIYVRGIIAEQLLSAASRHVRPPEELH